jgi:hypothetical protein
MIPVTVILPLLKRLVTNKWFWIGLLIATLIFTAFRLQKVLEENKRLSNNYEVAMEDFGKEKDKSGELRVTVGELEDIISEDSTLIAHLYDSLGLKDNQIQQVMKLKQETKIETVTTWKDKVVYVTDSSGTEVPTDSRCFEFKDDWVDISGCQLPEAEKVKINISMVDDITVVAYKYKDTKWFLSKLWKPWKYEVAVENSNPYNEITISKNIKVVKR